LPKRGQTIAYPSRADDIERLTFAHSDITSQHMPDIITRRRITRKPNIPLLAFRVSAAQV
jgi:hypothetical protein